MNKQIIEEAADWFVEFSTGDADQDAKRDFDRWLRKSPEHVRVYLEMLPIWDDGAIPLPDAETSAEELIALARGKENIVPLERPAPSIRERPAAVVVPELRGRSSAIRRVALAASIALVVIGGASIAWLQVRWPSYSTDLGQQRSVRLSDGSRVELNTRSRIRVSFTREARDIELLEGQALFNVAKDPQRPFTVKSDTTQVRAVGTTFDVYRKTGGTIVTVVEGRVSVNPRSQSLPFEVRRKGNSPVTAHSSPAGRESETVAQAERDSESSGVVLLSAGEQITVSAAAPPTPQRADIAVATAWTQGRLIFDSTPLPEVAEEFNRYNTRRIIVTDPALHSFNVNGSFRSSEPASLLRFLKEQRGLAVHESGSEIRVSRY